MSIGFDRYAVELDAEYGRALAKIGESAMTLDKFKAKIAERQQQQDND